MCSINVLGNLKSYFENTSKEKVLEDTYNTPFKKSFIESTKTSLASSS